MDTLNLKNLILVAHLLCLYGHLLSSVDALSCSRQYLCSGKNLIIMMKSMNSFE